MKEFIDNKTIGGEDEFQLQYYLVGSDGKYGIAAEILGNSMNTSYVHNISNNKQFTKNLANCLLKNEVCPETLADVIEDLV